MEILVYQLEKLNANYKEILGFLGMSKPQLVMGNDSKNKWYSPYYEEAKKLFDEYPDDNKEHSFIDMYYEYIGTIKADFICTFNWTMNALYPTPPSYYSELVYVKDNKITDTLLTAEGEIKLVQKEGNDIFFSVYSEEDCGGLYRFDLETEEFEKLVSGSNIKFVEANRDYIHYQQDKVKVYVRSTGDIITADYSDYYYYTESMLGRSTLYYPNDDIADSYNALDLITGEISLAGDRDSVRQECERQNAKDSTYTVEDIEDIYNNLTDEGFSVTNNYTGVTHKYFLQEYTFDYIGAMEGKLYFNLFEDGIMQFDPQTKQAAIITYDTETLNFIRLDTEENIFIFNQWSNDEYYEYKHGTVDEPYYGRIIVCEIA